MASTLYTVLATLFPSFFPFFEDFLDLVAAVSDVLLLEAQAGTMTVMAATNSHLKRDFLQIIMLYSPASSALLS